MTDARIRSYTDIRGWFFPADRALFSALLDSQDEPGTIAELGAYLGRSAVIMGDHLRDGERFVVVDLFGSEVELGANNEGTANRRENRHSYRTLTQEEFERNYLALHPALPEVVQAPTSHVGQHLRPGEARFVHIDASHLYAQVVDDIRNVRTALRDNGIVVFDDFSNPNCPGVAAAVWEAVATGGLTPFASTPHKLYATWGDPARHLDTVRRFLVGSASFAGSEIVVAGRTVIRMKSRPADKPAAPPTTDPVTFTARQLDTIAAGLARRLDPPRRRSDFVPPAVARAIRRRRRPTT